MVLLFIQITNNYLSSFINNCWLGLNSIIKYQLEIEDKVIVDPENGRSIYLMIICVVFFFDSENAVETTTMPVFYRDSNNISSCKRLDKNKKNKKNKKKSYSISQ